MGMAIDKRDYLDASAHLSAWGPLIHYWWVIVATALIGGIVGFAIAENRAPLYETRALVVGSDSPIEADTFGSLARVIFDTDPVIQPVINSLGLDTTVEALVASNRLEVEGVPRAVAVWVTGRSRDPEFASELANEAAASFASLGSEQGLGTLEVFDPASVPTSTPSRQTPATTIAGVVVGGSLGLAATLLFIFVTRPVLSKDEALRLFPASASFSVKVRVPFTSRLRRRKAAHRARGRPRVVNAIWRAVEADAGRSPSVLCCLVERRVLAKRATREFVARLAPEEGTNSFRRLNAKDDGLVHALRETQALIAVCSVGASAHTLHRLAEEAAAMREAPARVLVFIN